MQYLDRINAIRHRTARIGVPLGQVLAVAGVPASTLMRWERPDANPRMRSMLRALDAMEAELSRREAALVAELTGEQAA